MQIRVLILEDNPSDAELMQRELRKASFDFAVRWAQDQAAFIQALDESSPDIILADYALPGFDGVAAMSMARQRFPEIPVVIVSGAIGEETAIETLKAGATDYVLKQRLSRLGPVVHRALQEAKVVAERRQAEESVVRAKEEWERTFNAVPDLIAILDNQRRILRVNQPLADRLGLTPEECIGVPCYEAIHGQPIPPAFCPVPLTYQDGKVHVVEVHEPRLGGDFLVSTTPLFDDKGQLVGIIHVARDITDRKRAEEALQHQFHTLQRALLPEAPSIGPGYKVASAYIPAFAGQEIGGDFYDIFETEDERVGILIGDVSGKGVEAASLGVATRNTLRAFAYETSSSAEALTHTNSLLVRQQIAAGSFVTVFLAILDLPSGGIRYTSAGHPPPIVYRPDGSIETLDFGDIPVGIAEKYGYRETHCHLGPGDKMVLYTDGITEARHASELFGVKGLERVVAEHGSEDPEGLIVNILAAADNWARGRPVDDIAIIAVEREAD